MSKIFGIHFAAHDESGRLHQWGPGDDVPEWMESLVGDHCLLVPPEETDEPEDADSGEEADEDLAPAESDPADADTDADDSAEAPAADAAPDFTKPAARRGRAPKQA